MKSIYEIEAKNGCGKKVFQTIICDFYEAYSTVEILEKAIDAVYITVINALTGEILYERDKTHTA